MTTPSASLSRLEFDRLMARASRRNDEGSERIDLERARAIAQDLGINAAAWDAAFHEEQAAMQIERAQRAARQLRRRASIVALAGITAGGLSGTMASQWSDGVLFLGGAAVAAAVAHLILSGRRQPMRRIQVDLAAWWLSIPAGIMLGMRGSNGDPFVFAAVSWAACAALSVAIDRTRHRAPAPPPLPGTITAEQAVAG